MSHNPRYLWTVSLSALVLFSLLFIDSGESQHWRIVTEAKQFAHVVLFALIGYRVSYSRKFCQLGFLAKCGVMLALGMGLGWSTEALQSLIGRDFEWQDVSRDVLGCFAGFALHIAITQPRLRNSFAITTVILIGIGGKELWIAMIDEMDMSHDYALLGDFETPFQWTRWQSNTAAFTISDKEKVTGHYALQVDLEPAAFSGIQLTEFNPDWSDYEGLELHIYNGDAVSREFYIKIFDHWHQKKGYLYHDRFNGRVRVKPGWNSITLSMRRIRYAPSSRVMNLSQIAGLEIFTTDLHYPIRIYLDDLKLLRSRDHLSH